MALKFKCRNCGKEIVAKWLKIDELVRCRSCGEMVTVPVDATTTDEESTLLGVKVPETSPGDSQAQPKTVVKGRAKDPNYPSIGQAIWLMIAILVLILVFTFVAGSIGMAFDYRLTNHPWTGALTTFAAIVFMLCYGINRTGLRFNEVFSFKSFSKSTIFPQILVLLGCVILLSEVDNAMRFVLAPPRLLSDVHVNAVKASFWGSFVGMVFLAPLGEELLMRGLVLRGFLARYSVRKAIVVSALLFAILHLNPWQMPSAFAFGVLFGWLFVKTKSLWPCLLGHAAINLLVITSIQLVLKIRGISPEFERSVQFQPLWLDLLGLLLFGYGLWVLIRAFKREGEHAVVQTQ